MSALGTPHFVRRSDAGAPLFGEQPTERKSASHGEAGYARAARDFYPTEPWVTRALLAEVDFTRPDGIPADTVIWEPACGDGRMCRVIDEARYYFVASDIHDYGYRGTVLGDFLRDPAAAILPADALGQGVHAVITNPPFDLAREFIARALRVAEPKRGKVAILQRHEFDAPKGNRPLFAWPFAAKLILPRRPRWSDSDPKSQRASPRFPYAWYLWDWRHEGEPVIRWLDDVAA